MLRMFSSNKQEKKKVSPMSFSKSFESPGVSKAAANLPAEKPIVVQNELCDTHHRRQVQNASNVTPVEKKTTQVAPSLHDRRAKLQDEKSHCVRSLRRIKRRLFLDMVEPDKQHSVSVHVNRRALDKKSRTGKE
mmetsp:Transcript_13792/g.28110  ORF Transcript_13792/g.28110 Transcript_13792/m.28110 type:complete len:134 (-) Transcript_13792:205-606(-)